jgi:hypothetical protein
MPLSGESVPYEHFIFPLFELSAVLFLMCMGRIDEPQKVREFEEIKNRVD